MRKLFKLFIITLGVILSAQISFAEEYKILVLPDNIQFESTNYYVYPDSSILFASDTINELKKSGKIEIVSMAEVRDALRKNPHLSILTKKALKEFKYNYNISFVDIKEITKYFGTNKVLIISSQTDIQNYFLRRTLWDFLNIPGKTVIDPAYKMATYVALIDVDKEFVMWQHTYYKNISAMECRMIAQNFAPATEQLEKIKFYSLYYFSPDVSKIVQEKILPPVLPNQNEIIEVSDQKQLDTTVPIPAELIIRPKITVPKRVIQNGCGANVNDL